MFSRIRCRTFYKEGELEQGVKQIFEEKNRLPEAIVCVDDAIAYRLLDVLDEKDITFLKI